MFFTGQEILDFLSVWGYMIILPLMIIEGPVVTILSAMLAATGFLNPWIVLVISIVGDVLGDVILYQVGKKWGMRFVDRVGKYLGITKRLVLKMEKYFENHGGKTIFAVKSTTGLCWATWVAAGIAKMNFGKFVGYSILGGVIWSGFLVAMGYFYGYMWREIKQYIEWAGWLAMGLAVTTFVIITFYKKYKSKEIMGN
ncbi:MAG: DedA family protein [Candidatus Moraniibacteriota bacterium]